MKLARQKGLILSHPGEMGAPLRTDIKIKCHLLFPIQRFKGTKEARLVAGCVCVCVCVCGQTASLRNSCGPVSQRRWPPPPSQLTAGMNGASGGPRALDTMTGTSKCSKGPVRRLLKVHGDLLFPQSPFTPPKGECFGFPQRSDRWK